MKKTKKITSILMAATITMGMLVGCGSKTTAASTTTSTTTPKASTNKGDSTAMKTTYTNVLKALVVAKTITQVQSDKVLAVLVKATPPGGGSQADGKKPSGTPPTDNQKPSGSVPTGKSDSKNAKLSVLVTSKVITKAQATTINKNLQAAMKSSQSTKTN
ncbi:hypothetical protein [Clostridium psychrophilum]|uniref:hypothetical protein n=1 Tax=Clostridium psychrophilum TaxID=132926 RepID=UPI001C0C0538|nr:hypothetical protein [Clostridium psychrophilum]MBU3179574.1 hypothetical protein [Clostridium psychrophilum]